MRYSHHSFIQLTYLPTSHPLVDLTFAPFPTLYATNHTHCYLPILPLLSLPLSSPSPHHKPYHHLTTTLSSPSHHSPKHQSLTRKSFGGGNYDGVGYVDTQGRLLGQVVPIPCSEEEDVLRVGAGVSPQGGGEGVATRQVSYLINYK